MIILKQTILRLVTRLAQYAPNLIDFHLKLNIAVCFLTRNIPLCEHDMLIADSQSYCRKCGADFVEAIEFRYEKKEFYILREILHGRALRRVNKLFDHKPINNHRR